MKNKTEANVCTNCKHVLYLPVYQEMVCNHTNDAPKSGDPELGEDFSEDPAQMYKEFDEFKNWSKDKGVQPIDVCDLHERKE